MRGYPEIPLAGAVVLITGGGRGIGAATAAEFFRLGATVHLGDLDQDVAAEQADRLGPRVFAHHLDVTDRASYEGFVAAATERSGPVDVLVNNAGVMPAGAFLAEPDAVSRTTLDVNVWGLIHGMRLVLPGMVERGRGHVVNIASMAGKLAIPGLAVYNASKFAAVGLTAAVRQECAGTGVSVSAVLPSAVRTGLSSGIPLGRGMPTVDPERVAAAVAGSVRSRRAEIPVPGYLAGWDLVGAVTPEPLFRLVGTLVRNRRALTEVDPAARASYDERIARQAGGTRSA